MRDPHGRTPARHQSVRLSKSFPRIYLLSIGYDGRYLTMPSPSSRNPVPIVVLAVLVVSMAIRLLPYAWSPLPYNIDGLSELRVAEDIMADGDLGFSPDTSHSESYVTDMPVLGLLVAFVSSSIGFEAVDTALLMTALLGAIAVAIISLAFLRFLPGPRSFTASASPSPSSVPSPSALAARGRKPSASSSSASYSSPSHPGTNPDTASSSPPPSSSSSSPTTTQPSSHTSS